MKDWFLSQGLSLYVEIVLLMAGLVTLWITGRNYKRLIREADSMGHYCLAHVRRYGSRLNQPIFQTIRPTMCRHSHQERIAKAYRQSSATDT